MAVRTSAGSLLKISAGVPATFNTAGYSALTYTTIGEITDFGEFGREYTLVTHNPVANRGTVKFKGSFNEGTMTLQLGLDTDDAGQILAKSAVNSDNNYAFEMTTQNGDKYYFQAQVMNFKVGVGDVNKITSATIMVEITTSNTGVGIVESLAA
jgi:hypothetical protein